MRSFFSKKRAYYSISEIAKLVGINAYVLRFWEDKFPKYLHPKKNKSGRRQYTPDDLEMVLTIVDLLYNRRFTIEGALKELNTKSTVNLKKSITKKSYKNEMMKRSIKNNLRKLKRSIDLLLKKYEIQSGEPFNFKKHEENVNVRGNKSVSNDENSFNEQLSLFP